jgi:hypothetical protein
MFIAQRIGIDLKDTVGQPARICRPELHRSYALSRDRSALTWKALLVNQPRYSSPGLHRLHIF